VSVALATGVGECVWVGVELGVGDDVAVAIIWVGVRVGVSVAVGIDAGKTLMRYVKPGSPLASSRKPGGTSSLRASMRTAADPGIRSAPARMRSPLTSRVRPALHGSICGSVSEQGAGGVVKIPGMVSLPCMNSAKTIVISEAASATVNPTSTGIVVLPPSGG
jgi:hypothetical protein